MLSFLYSLFELIYTGNSLIKFNLSSFTGPMLGSWGNLMGLARRACAIDQSRVREGSLRIGGTTVDQ